MKQLKQTYLRYLFYLTAAFLVLMIVGSFFDLKISMALYPGHETELGQFFAAFGKLPAFQALSCAGVLLFVRRNSFHSEWGSMIGFCGAALTLFSVILCAYEAANDVPAMPFAVALLVSVFSAAVTGFAVTVFSREAPSKTILRFVLTLIFVAAASMLLVNIVKIPWSRARMRLIAQTFEEDYFTPWWHPGNPAKKALLASGVDKDEFRSFPSGHASCAACGLLAALLPTLRRSSAKRQSKLYLLIPCAWLLAVAFSRLWMGAHFLTDVAFGYALTLGMCVLGVYLFYFNNKFFSKIWTFLQTVPNPFPKIGKQ